MPVVNTDDGPRRLRALWLGPKGASLPFEWTYVQWAVTLLLATVVGLIAFGGMWLATKDLFYAVAAYLVWGCPAGVYLAVKVMKRVTFDEPLQYKVATIRGQLRRKHRQPVRTRLDRAISVPTVRHLPEATLDRLGWVESGQRALDDVRSPGGLRAPEEGERG